MAYNMKKEEDVKEYLKNLYTEYKFGCWSEKKADVCHLLGDYEESINTDFKQAANIYKKNCDEYDFPRSCAKFAGYLFHGKEVEKDEQKAYDYFKKSCDKGDGIGCNYFGILATSAMFNANHPEKSKRFDDGLQALRTSCYEYHQEKACFNLGSLFIRGVKDHLERNYQEGYKAMLQSCEYANPYACANISRMHAEGEGAEKNEELAKLFKERALDFYNQMTTEKRGVNFQQGTTS